MVNYKEVKKMTKAQKETRQLFRNNVLRGMRNPKTYIVGKQDMRKEMYNWYKQFGGKLTYQQAIKNGKTK